MTRQPDWKYIVNLGDAQPFVYGGAFLFEDTTGIYEPEIEIYEPETQTVYRFSVDKMDWSKETSWFKDKLKEVANCVDRTEENLSMSFESDDLIERAMAYLDVAFYFGYHNFDDYPLYGIDDYEFSMRYSKYGIECPNWMEDNEDELEN